MTFRDRRTILCFLQNSLFAEHLLKQSETRKSTINVVTHLYYCYGVITETGTEMGLKILKEAQKNKN